MKVILEGSDLSGKTTAVNYLRGMLPIQDRLIDFTESIEADRIDYERLDKAVLTKDTLFIILVIRDESILLKRLKSRPNPDKYDLQCLEYNRQYQVAAKYLADRPNVVVVEGDGLNKYQKTAKIVEVYLMQNDVWNSKGV